jgi:diguanylate cyclase (GGDEF)-like protein
LTGLGNRRQLEQSLRREAERLSATGGDLSVILLDIDFFKRFNDLYGHIVGDRCIVQVAATLHRAARRVADVTVRFGGEEFACVLPGTPHEEVMEIAKTIGQRISALGIPHDASETAPFVALLP